MKKWLAAVSVAVAINAASLPAYAAKDCGELRNEIAAKIDARGVKSYTLEVVAPEAVGDSKVVGSCAGGTQRIAYHRDTPPRAEAIAKADAAPAAPAK